jgi:hypothetical protein
MHFAPEQPGQGSLVPCLLPLRMRSILEHRDLMPVFTAVVIVPTLHRGREEGLRLLPDPARSLRNHAQADPLLGDQSRRLDLPERFRRLVIRVHWVPAQHLDDPVGGEQVEAEPFGFPPLPAPPGPLRHCGQTAVRCSSAARCVCSTKPSVTAWVNSWRWAKTACVSSAKVGDGRPVFES